MRGRLMVLFNISGLGLRTFSGFTVGILGSFIGIHWSLGLSTGLLLVVTLVLLAFVIANDSKDSLAAAESK